MVERAVSQEVWAHNVEIELFRERLETIRDEALEVLSPSDSGRELWGYIGVSISLSVLGWSLSLWSWGGLSALGVVALALSRFSRWILAHHICHRAYDQASLLPAWLKSSRFGLQGWARWLWVDWMPTEAWSYEHNVKHHAYTNQRGSDPDFVEEKAGWLRDWEAPVSLKLLVFTLGSLVWKPLYYGPNTLLELRSRGGSALISIYSWEAWSPLKAPIWTVISRSWLPYLSVHFALPISLGFFVFGGESAQHLALYLLLVEGLTNLYSFVMIVPNHAGADLYQFEGRGSGRGQFYLRQILSSCNYHTGHPIIDFLHGYLNYQIEHHLWPQLTMSQYRWIQPRVRALCEEFGIPYVQEPVWRRVVKLARLSVGSERAPLLRCEGVEGESVVFHSIRE